MIRETDSGVLIEVVVKPDSGRFRLCRKGDKIILEVTSTPKEGRANLEIVKGLKKMFGKDVKIVKGWKSREKVILLRERKVEK